MTNNDSIITLGHKANSDISRYYAKDTLDNSKDTGVISNTEPTNLENCIGDMALAGGEQQVYARRRIATGVNPETGKPQYTMISGYTEEERTRNTVKALLTSGQLATMLAEIATVKEANGFIDDLNKEGMLRGYIIPTVQQEVKPEEPVKTVFKEFLDREWLPFLNKEKSTYKREKNSYNRIMEYLGDKYIEDMTAETIQAFLDYLATTPIKQNGKGKKKDNGKVKYRCITTIKDTLGTLKRMLDITVEEGLLKRNPAKDKRLEVDGAEPGVTRAKAIPFETFKRMVEEIHAIPDKEFRLMIALFSQTGMRPSEVRGLKWEDIDFDKKILTIRTKVTHGAKTVIGKPKSGKRRKNPISDILLKELEEQRRESGWIFEWEEGKPISGDPWEKHYAPKFKEYGNKYGFDDLNPKDFRTTVATILCSLGYSEAIITLLLGHVDIDITIKNYLKYDTTIMDQYRQLVPEALQGVNLQKNLQGQKSLEAAQIQAFQGL